MLPLHKSESPNLAPAQPLQQAAERKAKDRTVEVDTRWFMAKRQELEQEDEKVWRDTVLLWELIFGMVEGKSLARRGRNGGWRWVPMPQRTDEPVYGYNLMGFYSDNIKAKWTQSNTDVNWRPTSDKDKAGGSAKAADKISDYYERRIYTQNFRQTEAMLAQCGKYARYYYYSDEAKRKARRPIYEEQQLKLGDSTYFCPDCGEIGLADDAGMSGAVDGGEGLGNPAAIEHGAGDLAAAMGAGQPGIPTMPAMDDDGLRGGAGPAMGGMPSASGQPGAPGALGIDPATREAINAQYGHDEVGEWEAGMEAPHPPELEGMEPDEDQHLKSIGVCPHCGSPNAEITHAQPFNVTNIAGMEEYETGDIVCESVPAFELKHDIGMNPQESPYLIRRRRIRTDILQAKFTFLPIGKNHSDNQGMRAEDELKTSVYGSSTGAYGGQKESSSTTAEFIQIWLDPCMYSQAVLREDMTTLAGVTLPAGTRLIDVFPDGMYQCWIQGIDGVIELRNEHHRDYWVGQVYRMRAISALGSGLEDMVEGQRQYNLVMSIIYTQLRTAAMPATLFEQQLLPNGVSAYLGSLSNIPVDTNVLDGKRLSDAVHQLSPQPPTGQHFSYAQAMDIYLQKSSRVTDIGLGQALGMDNSTATGSQIASANAQALFAPQLALKAEVDRRGAEIILELFRKYTPDEVYIALSGKRGELDGVWLSQADIETDLFAEVALDSYLPQTNLERRDRWRQFLMDMGGLPGLKAAMDQMPNLVEQLSELYDVDLGAEDYSAAAEVCFRRIEQMKAAEPMAQVWIQGLPPTQMAADPATGQLIEVPIDPMQEAASLLLQALDPPIEAEEMGHLAAVFYLRSWLTEDEGLNASPILRAGVKAMIAAHFQGMIQEQQMMGVLGSALQMPMMPPPAGGAAESSGPTISIPNRPRPNDKMSENLKSGRQVAAAPAQ